MATTVAHPHCCVGIPGKPCPAVFLAEAGFVPQFKKISPGRRLSEQQVLAAARCRKCARLYTKVIGDMRMYPLAAALAQVRKSVPTTSLGALLETSSLLKKSRATAAESVQQEEASRRRTREEQTALLRAAAENFAETFSSRKEVAA